MTPITVDTLLTQIAAAIYTSVFDTSPSPTPSPTGDDTATAPAPAGSAPATRPPPGCDLAPTGTPPTPSRSASTARRLRPGPPGGRHRPRPDPAAPRWGLQLDVSTIDVHHVKDDIVADAAAALVDDHRVVLPSHSDTVGLVDTINGDDARTVVAAIRRLPAVIVGIGHATHRTAADAAAYLSCITPTAAAHAIVASAGGAQMNGSTS